MQEPGKQNCLAWLDVTNAFGAIPHLAIDDALSAAQGCRRTSRLVRGSSKVDPLVALLFNLCIDPVLRQARKSSNNHNVLAFADDILHYWKIVLLCFKNQSTLFLLSYTPLDFG
ncbi:hypothetical protein CEXT_179171 [Caerostris extrusa]|uniref:Reverse transcriptase domain-containing protein n=1 Tax=Caerostris extrusa TaxID=172846 RepID=A0AAV4QWE2_CAEEX|nr:hypothetical protein CEXT_179171 [Caerostris extrusa]